AAGDGCEVDRAGRGERDRGDQRQNTAAGGCRGPFDTGRLCRVGGQHLAVAADGEFGGGVGCGRDGKVAFRVPDAVCGHAGGSCGGRPLHPERLGAVGCQNLVVRPDRQFGGGVGGRRDRQITLGVPDRVGGDRPGRGGRPFHPGCLRTVGRQHLVVRADGDTGDRVVRGANQKVAFRVDSRDGNERGGAGDSSPFHTQGLGAVGDEHLVVRPDRQTGGRVGS